MDSEAMMQVYLIQESILKELKYSDLKSFRLVCSTWEDACRSRFVAASSCIINMNSRDRDLASYQRDFPGASLFPFESFQLCGQFEAEELERFFRQQPFVKQLKLQKTSLTDRNGKSLKEYAVSNWNELNLHHLVIESEPNLTKYRISLAHMQSIKTLSLKHAIVEFNGQISPSTLRFNLINCIVDGEELKAGGNKLNVNEYVEVTNLKVFQFTAFNKLNRLHSDSYDARVPQIPLELDLTNCLRLEHLYLHQINVLGWHKDLTIKKVEFDYGFNVGHLWYYYSFPPSVREIVFNFFTNTGTVIFDTNLRYIQRKNEFPHNDPRFFARPITHINCGLSYTHRLPSGIKRIQINDECGNYIRMVFVDDPDTRLEKLVEGRRYYGTECSIVPNTIVFDCTDDSCDISQTCYECGGAIDDLLSAVVNHVHGGGTFVLRKIRHTIFENYCDCDGNRYSHLFDIDADYILCRGNQSKAISKEEFQEWVDSF